MEREAYCRIIVICSGEALKREAEKLCKGQQVKVSGFIARADHRQGRSLLVLHAQSLQAEAGSESLAN